MEETAGHPAYLFVLQKNQDDQNCREEVEELFLSIQMPILRILYVTIVMRNMLNQNLINFKKHEEIGYQI